MQAVFISNFLSVRGGVGGKECPIQGGGTLHALGGGVSNPRLWPWSSVWAGVVPINSTVRHFPHMCFVFCSYTFQGPILRRKKCNYLLLMIFIVLLLWPWILDFHGQKKENFWFSAPGIPGHPPFPQNSIFCLLWDSWEGRIRGKNSPCINRNIGGIQAAVYTTNATNKPNTNYNKAIKSQF